MIQIGPPNIQLLKSKDKKSWAAKDVADSVLSDKSALVILLGNSCIVHMYDRSFIFGILAHSPENLSLIFN